MKARNALLELICFSLISLFVYTSASKWMSFRKFSNEMNFQSFDDRFTPALVILVPTLELAIGLLLIFRRTRSSGLVAAFMLVFTYTVYIVLIQLKVWEHYPCSCIGVIRMSWTEHLYFNTSILLLIVAGIFLLKTGRKNVTMLNQMTIST